MPRFWARYRPLSSLQIPLPNHPLNILNIDLNDPPDKDRLRKGERGHIEERFLADAEHYDHSFLYSALTLKVQAKEIPDW